MNRTVDISNFIGLGLIVLSVSGVHFTSQVAGHACAHPSAEGVFVPFPMITGDFPDPLLKRLADHFHGAWMHLTEEDASLIERELVSRGLSFLTVDRARLEESFEAWVYVKIVADSTDRFLEGFSGSTAILVWPNSD